MKLFDALVPAMLHPALLVGIGSAIGGNLRYWVGCWIDSMEWAEGLPLGTFIINVSGSLLLGFVGAAFLDRVAVGRRELFLLLGTGLCGGYTTFSTFEWETYKLIKDGSWGTAICNVTASVLFGLLGLYTGVFLAHLVFGRR